jgi:ArsR family transcriptional regulator
MQEDNEFCEEKCVHEDIVQAVRQEMPGYYTILALAEIFKTLGDPTRIKTSLP